MKVSFLVDIIRSNVRILFEMARVCIELLHVDWVNNFVIIIFSPIALLTYVSYIIITIYLAAGRNSTCFDNR